MVAQLVLVQLVEVQILLGLQFAALVKRLTHHTFYVRAGVRFPYAVLKCILYVTLLLFLWFNITYNIQNKITLFPIFVFINLF